MPKKQLGRRIFTYDEALSTFPLVRDLTTAAVRQIEALTHGIGSREELDARREDLEEAEERIVSAWAREVAAGGCEATGIWLADWGSGDGSYRRPFPEPSVPRLRSDDEVLP